MRGSPHRRRFGLELQRWCDLRGVTLRGLARLIPCSHATVQEVAAGEDWPAPWLVVRADWCLGADRRLWEVFAECWLEEEPERPGGPRGSREAARHHRDGRLLLGPEEVGLRVVELSSRIVVAVASWTPEMKRRHFLRWTSFGAACLPAVVVAGGVEGAAALVVGAGQPTRADEIAIEQLRDTVAACRQLDDLGVPATVLQITRRALARVEELLRGLTSPTSRRPLTLIAAELSQLAGYVAVGLHDAETARAYTARALAAADEAGSPELHAYTMSLNGRDLEWEVRGDSAAASSTAAAAQDWARLSGNPAVLSYAHSTAARTHAVAGRDGAALRALDEAERCHARSAPEERPTWLYWYDDAARLADRGECYVDLHRGGRTGGPGLDETVAVLHEAAAARAGRYPREVVRDHLNLADAYWTHGEREAAARHASSALLIARGIEWRRLWQRLEGFRRRMEGDPLPAARDFVERYRTAVPG